MKFHFSCMFLILAFVSVLILLPPGCLSASNVDNDEEDKQPTDIPEEQQERLEREERKRKREARLPKGERVRAPRPHGNVGNVGVNTPQVSAPRDEGPMSDPWSDNFLILLRAREGISHWKYVVNDFMLLGMDTNRTIVEPCVRLFSAYAFVHFQHYH